MKALVRNKGETVDEDMNLPGIDWKTGYPLTEPGWAGGPYAMVQNYVPPADEENVVQPEQPEVEEEIIEDVDDYVTIDGKKYSKTELRSLLE